jgi:hypothetical protein
VPRSALSSVPLHADHAIPTDHWQNRRVNRFIELAQRSALAGWSLEDVNRQLTSLPSELIPTHLEMDEARVGLKDGALDYPLASAVDMLFDAEIPGIPDDPEHNRGNVHYLLADAWLARVRLGEPRGKPHFWRHCEAARQFYATWPAAVPGTLGHPAWAGVLELEVQMLGFTPGPPSVSDLHRGLDLCHQASPCYPASNKYWPVVAWEAQLHLKLAQRELEEPNLREALKKLQIIRSYLPRGDEVRLSFLEIEVGVWRRLEPYTTTQDRATADDFASGAFGEVDPDHPLFKKVQDLRLLYMKASHRIDPPITFLGRVSRTLSKLLFD